MKTWVAIVFSLIAALLVAGAVYEYPYLVAQSREKEWPTEWNADLYNLNHRQIVEKLGAPSEDVSAKQYQSWLKREDWGMLQLKIEFKDCCDEASTPSGIYKIVRVKNRYEPLQFAKLAPPDGTRPIRTISVAGQHARAMVILHPNRVKDESGSLERLEILVNDEALFVPRSVYFDLTDIRDATLRSEGKGYVLTLSGGDGAESYFSQIYFDAVGVKHKKLFSSLVPDEPTEEIRYRLRLLKDE
jgi:hypothetical protein